MLLFQPAAADRHDERLRRGAARRAAPRTRSVISLERRAAAARRRRRRGADRGWRRAMPSWRNPASSVIRLRRLRTNSSAPTTSTSDSATCATTSARRRPKRSRVSVEPRLPAFIAAPGAVRVARIAGIRPNSRHVASRERGGEREDRASRATARRRCGSLSVVRKPTRNRLSHCASSAPHAAPIAGDQQALGQQLPDDAPARRADREPHGNLALARGRAREHQVREVGAGDQQHERRWSRAAATAATRSCAAATTRRCRPANAPSLNCR